MLSPKQEGVAFAHMAALLFGGTALYAKLISLSSEVITFWRTVVAILVLVLICKLRGRSFSLGGWRPVLIQIGLGLILGIHWASYYEAIQLSTVAIGVTALFTAPMLSVLIESVLNRKKPDAVDLLLCGVVLIGVLCLTFDSNWSRDYMIGVIFGVISAMFLALRQSLHRRAKVNNPSGMVLLTYQCIGILILFTFSGVTADLRAVRLNWFDLLILGSFFTAIPHFCNVNALRTLEAKSVLIITSLMVPYGMILSAMFLGEVPSVMTLIGSALVLSAATIENLRIGRS
ncbi:MAG: DMT family transporter [Lentimonas sp.]